MESQATNAMQVSNSTFTQIGFHDSPGKRPRHGEQTSCRFGRAGRRWRPTRSIVRLRLGSWQAQEASCLLSDIVEIDQTATFADHVEQVAVLASGGVGPFARRAATDVHALQTDEHRAAGCIPDVADLPVIADTAPVGEIVAAHRLCLAREAIRQVCCVAGHLTPPLARRRARPDSVPSPWRGPSSRSHRLAQRTAASRRLSR
jgi:hypothetical protein